MAEGHRSSVLPIDRQARVPVAMLVATGRAMERTLAAWFRADGLSQLLGRDGFRDLVEVGAAHDAVPIIGQ